MHVVFSLVHQPNKSTHRHQAISNDYLETKPPTHKKAVLVLKHKNNRTFYLDVILKRQ